MLSFQRLLRAALCLLFVVSVPALAGNTSATALSVAPNPVTQGNSTTLTATVTGTAPTPTGSVTFFDGMTSLGTVALNASGVATFTSANFSLGTHSLTANYGGDQQHPSSVSPAVVLTVTQAPPTSIPALGAFGLALLALGLVAFAWRRRHA